jgi:AcrR family transcriptional regulator
MSTSIATPIQIALKLVLSELKKHKNGFEQAATELGITRPALYYYYKNLSDVATIRQRGVYKACSLVLQRIKTEEAEALAVARVA